MPEWDNWLLDLSAGKAIQKKMIYFVVERNKPLNIGLIAQWRRYLGFIRRQQNYYRRASQSNNFPGVAGAAAAALRDLCCFEDRSSPCR